MRKLLYLINFELRRIATGLVIISVCMMAAQIVSFLFIASKSEYRYLRYEHLLELSAYPFLFAVFLGAVLLLIAISFFQNFHGSQSIYTLMTLPLKRSNIYISKYFSGLVAALIIAAVQVAGIFLTYGIYLLALPQIPKVNNGLFLAFMRSRFLRIFLPLDIYSFLVSLICIVSLTAIPLFVLLAIKSKKYFRVAIVPVIIFWSIRSIFHFGGFQLDNPNLLMPLVFIITCTVFMARSSIKALSSTEIL